MKRPALVQLTGQENGSVSPVRLASPKTRRVRARNAEALNVVLERLASPDPASAQATHLTAASAPRAPLSPRPAQAPADTAALYSEEAAAFQDLRHDQERITAYVTSRQQGLAPDLAREACKFGLYYLRCSQARRNEITDLLDQYGVSRSPLCWPRYALDIDVPLQDCPVLGTGRANTVYGISLGGKEYAFKPFTRVADRDPAHSRISLAGEFLGIKEDKFYPELRTIAAARIADSVSLSGEDGVVRPVCVALVQGVPGTMTLRVHGRSEGRGNFWNTAVSLDSKKGKYITQELTAAGANTLEKGQAVVHAIGLSTVTLDEDNALLQLTGTVGKRNEKALRRFASHCYNRHTTKLQAFAWMINLGDIHPGNTMYEEITGIGWVARLVDLEEALGNIDPSTLQFAEDDDSWIKADFSLAPTSLPAELRAQLQSRRCIEMNETLRDELRPYLPAQCLDLFCWRERELRASSLPDYENDMAWMGGDDLRPDLHQLDRAIGFSLHDFGDSEDSDSCDELDLPEAREIG